MKQSTARTPSLAEIAVTAPGGGVMLLAAVAVYMLSRTLAAFGIVYAMTLPPTHLTPTGATAAIVVAWALWAVYVVQGMVRLLR